jgi:hypothetical protein
MYDDPVDEDWRGPYREQSGRAELCELMFETGEAAEIPGMLLPVQLVFRVGMVQQERFFRAEM